MLISLLKEILLILKRSKHSSSSGGSNKDKFGSEITPGTNNKSILVTALGDAATMI